MQAFLPSHTSISTPPPISHTLLLPSHTTSHTSRLPSCCKQCAVAMGPESSSACDIFWVGAFCDIFWVGAFCSGVGGSSFFVFPWTFHFLASSLWNCRWSSFGIFVGNGKQLSHQGVLCSSFWNCSFILFSSFWTFGVLCSKRIPTQRSHGMHCKSNRTAVHWRMECFVAVLK